jgi:hypothetical protein
MKYITLAVHNNELFIIKDMDAFATLFCYSKKLRYDQANLIAPPPENPEDDEMPAYHGEVEDTEVDDEDEL